jgi:FkbM family methyltransferase
MVMLRGKMIQSVKDAVRNTGLYKNYQRIRLIESLKKWTPQDEEMLRFYSQFIPAQALCFDVGANIGNRVKIFLALNADVIAIEPQTECVGILNKVFGKNRQLKIIQTALGDREGEAEIMISDSSTISSMSPEWINAVKTSGRFAEFVWDQKKKVPLTTLDKLIDQYGTPAFIKIDVEGFEYQVLSGLTRPVSMLSLEYVPEIIELTYKCIDYLHHLGNIELNYTIGETMQLVLEKWTTPDEMKRLLSSISNRSELFGDVYLKFV